MPSVQRPTRSPQGCRSHHCRRWPCIRRQLNQQPSTRSSRSRTLRSCRLHGRHSRNRPRWRSRHGRLPHPGPQRPPPHRRRRHALTTVRVAGETTEVRREYRSSDRDRALRRIAYWSAGGMAGAAALTGAISAVSAASYAGATPAGPLPVVPIIPVETTPSQAPRPTPAVIVEVIHVPGATVYTGKAGISPPRRAPISTTRPSTSVGPVAPPPPAPPPPPPACHSTPSHPC
jgi:hypothetical protein